MERRRQTDKWPWSQKSDLEVTPWVFFLPQISQTEGQRSRQPRKANGHTPKKKSPTKTSSLCPKHQKRGSLARQKPLENNHSTSAKHHTSSEGHLGSPDLHPHQAVRRCPAPMPRGYQRRTKRKLGLPFAPGNNKAPHTVPVEIMWETWTSTPTWQ